MPALVRTPIQHVLRTRRTRGVRGLLFRGGALTRAKKIVGPPLGNIVPPPLKTLFFEKIFIFFFFFVPPPPPTWTCFVHHKKTTFLDATNLRV